MTISNSLRQIEATGQAKATKSSSLFDAIGVVLGAVVMGWPALYSGFPLMYPDTADYVHAGRPVAAAIVLGHRSAYYGMRSLIYSLGILPFHPGGAIWPIIAFQCLLTSWVLWLVFRSVLRTVSWTHFVGLIVVVSVFSSLSWFGSFVTPDILGSNLYLCIYLMVFARDSLSRVEQALVPVVSWWAMASHTTHLLISAVLCCALTAAAVVMPRSMRKYRGIAAGVGAVFAVAIGAQVLLNAFLYGKPSLTGVRPPFLTARLIEDGPGRWYLEKHCPGSGWEMCRYKDNLSGTSNHFLWDADGVWRNASPASQSVILQQEGALAKAIVRAYPREQFAKSARNFVAQLEAIDLGDFEPNPDIVLGVQGVLTGAGRYLESRQAQDRLHLDFFYAVHKLTVVLSLCVIVLLLPWLNRRRPVRLIALGYVVGCSVLANALLTGTLSMVCGRYESRVMWLVPMFAGLCFGGWLVERKIIGAVVEAECATEIA